MLLMGDDVFGATLAEGLGTRVDRLINPKYRRFVSHLPDSPRAVFVWVKAAKTQGVAQKPGGPQDFASFRKLAKNHNK